MVGGYERNELMDFGFVHVGEDITVSRDTKFYDIRDGIIGNGVRIDDYSILTGSIVFGDYVHISPFCFLSGTGGVIEMKDRSGIGSHVSVFTKSADYRSTLEIGDRKVTGPVVIGYRCQVGSGCRILPDVTIGDDASIGSNAVISVDIAPRAIVVSRGLGIVTVGTRRR